MSDTELTGRLLVATPLLVDPNFDRTVVLVLDHDTDGTLGVVINRPTTVPVHEVLPAWSELAGPCRWSSRADRSPSTRPWAWPNCARCRAARTRTRSAGAACTAIWAWSIWTCRRNCWPPRSRPSGCTRATPGWSAGQLERELGQGAWYVVDAAPADAFTLSPELAWRTVLRRQRGGLALLSTFPDDPEFN